MYLRSEQFNVFPAMQLSMSRAVSQAFQGRRIVDEVGSFNHGYCVPVRESSIVSWNSSRNRLHESSKEVCRSCQTSKMTGTSDS